ncbi:MAG TPA: glucosamine-6-phosphate deaminase [Planctomycetota bacterium]|nr:glucosamine-6-phosphate deaminase [Planctomycetota bacterium]
MSDATVQNLTPVERRALACSPLAALYPPAERIPAIVVDNFPALGKLAAMRFIEWAQANPGGVVSLPTGKTPEHFIRWVERLLGGWDRPEIRAELEAAGVDPRVRPDMKSLHFVQIDEFYPIDPAQHNSFHHYVSRYYLQGFGLDPARALLMDCSRIGLAPGQSMESVWPGGEVDLSLRHRAGTTDRELVQKAALAAVDQWCQDYEGRIRELGGIGFFLGGIGPDGHIGFNVRGSDHRSTTRLTPTNYETQAAAAVDLGGMEVARKRLVITIGLGTIAFNPKCAAIVIAAGEAKAGIVAAAVRSDPSVLHPATALQGLPNARFYLTMGAARGLAERRVDLIERAPAVSDEEVEAVLVDLAFRAGRRLVDLTAADVAADPPAAAVLRKRPEGLARLAAAARDSLAGKVERGARSLVSTRFLHTEPHHDDLMLGCLPYIVRNNRDARNHHCFATMTGGFTAVTNGFVLSRLALVRRFLEAPLFAEMHAAGYFDPENAAGRNRDVWQYLDGVAAESEPMKAEGAARRMLRNLFAVYGPGSLPDAARRIGEIEARLATAYAGARDEPDMRQFKSLCREWEADCMWGYFGWNGSNVMHLRLGFYTGDIFTEEPTVGRDVPPIVRVLELAGPDVVTVALDPEASGPDTHYKVLQAVSEALRAYEERLGSADRLRVVGYRNVWYRFGPAEANLYVPVSLNMFATMRSAFMNTFISQRDASFPSPDHDGPFCDLAQRIQAEQYQKVKTCLGRAWFHEHPSAMIRAARGLVFLREMTLAEFYRHSRELRRAAENRGGS